MSCVSSIQDKPIIFINNAGDERRGTDSTP
jgi:hypothetical protein